MDREKRNLHARRQQRSQRRHEHRYKAEYDQDAGYEEPPTRQRPRAYDQEAQSEELRARQRPPYASSSVRSSSSQYRVPAGRSVRSANPSPLPSSYTRTPLTQPRQRSIWPMLFTGCAIGVVLAVLAAAMIVVMGIFSLQNGKLSIPLITPSSRTISREEMQTVALSNISQIVVCDVIGNVLLKVDPQASKPTVTITKHIQASSQVEADQAFQSLAVAVPSPETLPEPLSSCAILRTSPTGDKTAARPTSQTGTISSPLSTAAGITSSNILAVNVTFLAKISNASVDLTIAIPQTTLPTSGPSTIVTLESAGNISVDGISGVLNIKDDSGNPQNSNDITVTHAALADGSKLSTTGAITFNGYLAQALNPNKTAFYILEGEKQIDVTLPSDTNVTLEAYAVSGSIKSQFALQKNLLQEENAMTSYHGPLNAAMGSPVNAQLTLHVGVGNLNIHSSQVPEV